MSYNSQELDKISNLLKETGQKVAEIETKSANAIASIRKQTEEESKRTNSIIASIRKQTEEELLFHTKRMNRIEGRYGNQIGELVEGLVEGNLVEILKSCGIVVSETATRVKPGDREWEIDVVAKNGHEVVAVEVKTVLRQKDVDHFIDKLSRDDVVFHFRKKNNGKSGIKLYGAMAYLSASSASAIKKVTDAGLIAIKVINTTAAIESGTKSKEELKVFT